MGVLGVVAAVAILGSAIWASRSDGGGLNPKKYALPILLAFVGFVVALIASGDLLMDLLLIWVAIFLAAAVLGIEFFLSLPSILSSLFNRSTSAGRRADAEPELVLSMNCPDCGREWEVEKKPSSGKYVISGASWIGEHTNLDLAEIQCNDCNQIQRISRPG